MKKILIIAAILALVLVSGCVWTEEQAKVREYCATKGYDGWSYGVLNEDGSHFECGDSFPISEIYKTPTATITEGDLPECVRYERCKEGENKGNGIIFYGDFPDWKDYFSCCGMGFRDKLNADKEKYIVLGENYNDWNDVHYCRAVEKDSCLEYATPPPEPGGTVSTVHTEIHEGIALQPLDNIEREYYSCFGLRYPMYGESRCNEDETTVYEGQDFDVCKDNDTLLLRFRTSKLYGDCAEEPEPERLQTNESRCNSVCGTEYDIKRAEDIGVFVSCMNNCLDMIKDYQPCATEGR